MGGAGRYRRYSILGYSPRYYNRAMTRCECSHCHCHVRVAQCVARASVQPVPVPPGTILGQPKYLIHDIPAELQVLAMCPTSMGISVFPVCSRLFPPVALQFVLLLWTLPINARSPLPHKVDPSPREMLECRDCLVERWPRHHREIGTLEKKGEKGMQSRGI